MESKPAAPVHQVDLVNFLSVFNLLCLSQSLTLYSHGIDSLNCTLASLCETAAVGLGHTKTGAFIAMVPCLAMFFSTWETYHTHTLYLGVFNGPTEGLIIACTLMCISGYYGPQIWEVPLSTILPDFFFHGPL